MITVKNIQTGELHQVNETYVNNSGVIYARWAFPEPSKKYYEKHPMLSRTEDTIRDEKHGVDCRVLALAEGWEIASAPKNEKKSGERKPRTSKAPKAPKSETPNQEQPQAVPEEPKKENGHYQPAPKADEAPDDDIAMAAKLVATLKGIGKASVDVSEVEAIADRVVRKVIAESKPHEVVHKIRVADMPEYKMPDGDEPSEMFKNVLGMVVNDRVIGRFPWLYGPAGSGKSTMAKHVADALGLPFYSVTSLQQKYELEGYTDAVGSFVETTFYKAMKNGGIFCFDEISTTSGEVQVAFNTAAAQLVYNFPKEGMTNAHKDFHIIACDNTTGRGHSAAYCSRYQMDVSTLDRYTFVEVGYTEEHDMRMACGDKELVTFIKAVRKAIESANTTHLASPRSSKAIKALQASGMSDRDAVWYGLCSGWDKQDIRTISERCSGVNKYFKAFKAIAED